MDRINLRSRDAFQRMGVAMRVVGCASLLACAGCSASTEEFGKKASSSTGAGGSSVVSVGAGGTGGVGGSILSTSASSGSGGGGIITSLPPGFLGTEIGGYKLGDPPGSGMDPDAGVPGNQTCGNVLVAVVRDFKGRNEPGGNPDFEGPLYGNNVTTGLVAPALGADHKPVYTGTCEEGHPGPNCPFGAETTTQANYNQWYRDTANVNKPYLLELWLAPQAGGLFTFQSLFFFPLDNAGWGNSGADANGMTRNFSFTTELHTQFRYTGGETFLFEGDDDVWVFINNSLAVDLGGLHPKESGSVSLDASAAQLGIVKGNVYPLDLFHAERHTPESTFRIDTNLAFVDCGTPVPN